jgi:hypothetical protein
VLRNFSQIHRQRLKRIQEFAMEFSPNDDIQKLLVKSVTGSQPKGEGATLSRRAELRVRLDTTQFLLC